MGQNNELTLKVDEILKKLDKIENDVEVLKDDYEYDESPKNFWEFLHEIRAIHVLLFINLLVTIIDLIIVIKEKIL